MKVETTVQIKLRDRTHAKQVRDVCLAHKGTRIQYEMSLSTAIIYIDEAATNTMVELTLQRLQNLEPAV